MAPDPTAALAKHFGFTAFRGLQEDVIRHVLAGGDALVIMATGEGKSLCYQLPALMQDGVTLVVSPLIALMEDQVAALRQRGIPATCIHSMMTADDRRQRLAATVAGEVKLLYVTPERFRVGRFLEEARALRVPLLAIDEAHCVSHWGHDFRPDYSRLGTVREALGSPPCVALTATATPDVQEDITSVLGIPEAKLFHTGIERPNLFLSVHEVLDEEAKLERVLQVIDTVGGPGIVYTALIRTLHQLEDQLRRRGLDPVVYHGDLSASERKEHQRIFMESRDRVVLATNAFGMGVDKADIRFILHYQVPRTLEAYYQEIGRAGRDGLGSFCELIYFEEDLSIQRDFTEWANPDAAFMTQLVQHLVGLGDRLHAVDVADLNATFLLKNRRDGRVQTCFNLLETAGCIRGEPGHDLELVRVPDAAEISDWLPDDKRERDLRGLLQMVHYARAEGCRKREIHRYFGFDDMESGCGSCDADTELEPWLATTLPEEQRRRVPRRKPGETPSRTTDKARAEGDGGDQPPPPLVRGDWIKVRGFGMCHVTRVHQQGRRTRVDVEIASDLSRRSFELRRIRWKKVDRDS